MTNATTQGESLSAHRLALARELVDDIELGRLKTETLLLKATRLARLMEDSETMAWLELELMGYEDKTDSLVVKYTDLTGRYTDKPKRIGYLQPLAGIIGWVQAMETELQSLNIPDVHFAPSSANPREFVGGSMGLGAVTAVGPANAAIKRKQTLTTSIAQMRTVISKIMGLLHSFVSKTYHELAFRGLAESIFESHKKAIDALLASTAGQALEKIPTIVERLAAGDPEAISNAMTTSRRVLAAFADAVQPPTDEKLLYGSEKIDAGPDQYLNRLRYYLKQNCSSPSREERLRQEVVQLNRRFSAGTHKDVTFDEARALFVRLYIALGEILSLTKTAELAPAEVEAAKSQPEKPGAAPKEILKQPQAKKAK